MSASEIVEKAKRYTLYDWQAQAKLAPIPVDRAEGVHFWDVNGKRYLDHRGGALGSRRPRRGDVGANDPTS